MRSESQGPGSRALAAMFRVRRSNKRAPTAYIGARYAFKILRNRASCSSPKLSHFAAFFLDRRAKVSIVISCARSRGGDRFSFRIRPEPKILRILLGERSRRFFFSNRISQKKKITDFSASRKVPPWRYGGEAARSTKGIDVR
jgi:hypothetical protein